MPLAQSDLMEYLTEYIFILLKNRSAISHFYFTVKFLFWLGQ